MQPDNTITPPTNPLTPAQLKAALDAWCEAQLGVMRWSNENEEFTTFIDTPEKPSEKYPKTCWVIADEDCERFSLFHDCTFMALITFAIENRYISFLRLAAQTNYTGSNAARLALEAMGEAVKDVEAMPLEEILTIGREGEGKKP